VVVVATENDSLYGLRATDGSLLWGPTHFGTPEPLSEIRQFSGLAGCGDIDPLGVTSDLAVDNGTVFAVGEVETGASVPHVPARKLVGVDPTNGHVTVGPSTVDAAGMTVPAAEQQRAGLAVANGNVYIGYGGLAGDCGDYHGWLVAANEVTGNIVGSYAIATTAGNRAGAIWAPGGATVDGAGKVYVSTGNSFSYPASGTDYSDAVVKFGSNPGSGPIDYFQPSVWKADNDADLDLGSMSPLLVSSGTQIFVIGKQHVAYLLNTNSLGGADHQTPAAQLSMGTCAAFGANAVLGQSIFVACSSGVREVNLTGSPATLQAGWTAPVAAKGPVTVGGGIVWSVDRSAHILYGLSPGDGSVQFRGALAAFDASQHFPQPVVSGSQVLVEDGAHVAAFPA
jgi:hypothetical protein